MSDLDGIFSRRTLVILLAVGGVAAIASFVMSVFGDGLGRRTVDPSAFSRSAIGYGSLVEVLRENGFPVVLSTNGTVRKIGDGTTLVLAEPFPIAQSEQLFTTMLNAPRVIVILPKWFGEAALQNSRWIGRADLYETRWPQTVLDRIDDRITVRRATVTQWTSAAGLAPSLGTAQLMTAAGSAMQPLVSSPQGVLLGRIDRGGRQIWILSDPDVVNNHGIDNGSNVDLAIDMFAAATPAGGALVFDETIHGFIDGNEVWQAAFRPPFLVPTLILLAAMVALLWNAVGRFGRALPETRPLPAGHKALIDNTAELLVMGGQAHDILRDYFDHATAQVAKALHVREETDDDRTRHLDQLARSRGLQVRHADLRKRVDAFLEAENPRGGRTLATDIHRWRKEMIYGS